jgi:hypothetical protein
MSQKTGADESVTADPTTDRNLRRLQRGGFVTADPAARTSSRKLTTPSSLRAIVCRLRRRHHPVVIVDGGDVAVMVCARCRQGCELPAISLAPPSPRRLVLPPGVALVDEAALEDLHASLLIERVFAGVESRGERRFVADR